MIEESDVSDKEGNGAGGNKENKASVKKSDKRKKKEKSATVLNEDTKIKVEEDTNKSKKVNISYSNINMLVIHGVTSVMCIIF